jgi:hypothetical protein
MTKIAIGTLTALALLVGAAVVQPAQARCWWNGYGWVCVQPHHWWWRHPYWYR